jgi:YggT family protein
MISSLLYGLAHVVTILLNLSTLIVIVSVALGWFGADPYNPYAQFIRRITEPVFRPIRQLTQGFTGPIDISPMVVMLVIVFLEKSLPTYLMALSYRMAGAP